MRSLWILLLVTLFHGFVLGETTRSLILIYQPINREELQWITGEDIELYPGEDGTSTARATNEAVRRLLDYGIEFEVLSSETRVGDPPIEKGTYTLSRTNSTGFAINFANTQNIVINDAPQDAVVVSVTVRVKGIAAYADLCDFALRGSWGAPNATQYNFPKWYDEIWFDHTVSNITVFSGQPVNQTWTLYGKGSNTAGERVEQWWLTITYTTESSGGNGNFTDYFDSSCLQSNVTHEYQLTHITQPEFYPYRQNNQYYVRGRIPLRRWVQVPYIPSLLGPLCVTLDTYNHDVIFRYGVPESMSQPLPQAMIYPLVDTLVFTVGSLSPGIWHFRTDFATITCPDLITYQPAPCDARPVFDQYVTISSNAPEGPPVALPEPWVAINGSPRVEEGQRVVLEAVPKFLSDPISYQWYKNGLPIPGSNVNKLVFDPITLSDAGRYKVEARTPEKLLVSQEFSLRVFGAETLPLASLGLLLVLCAMLSGYGVAHLRGPETRASEHILNKRGQ